MSKIVLITGASSGIGRATAEYLTQVGYRVYGTSRRSFEESVCFQTLIMDVTDGESVQKAINELLLKEQRIDILINNAGLGNIGALEEIPEEMMRQVFDTNVWGLLRVCRAVLPIMRQQQSGLIINVSSIAGMIGLPFRGIYCASKASVEILTETMRLEVRPFGVRVCSVLPGDVRTNINANRLVALGAASSPYRATVEAMNTQVNAEVSHADDPIYIARAIRRAIERRPVQIHYVAGPFSQKMAVWLKRILPNRWFEKLLRRSYGLR
ncbi:MAG: SDR family oxidoreductase [Runella sp.]